VRWVVNELLKDPGYRERAGAIGAAHGPNPGAGPAVSAIEELLASD